MLSGEGDAWANKKIQLRMNTNTHKCTCTRGCTNTDTHLPIPSALTPTHLLLVPAVNISGFLNMAAPTPLLSLQNTSKLGSNLQLGLQKMQPVICFIKCTVFQWNFHFRDSQCFIPVILLSRPNMKLEWMNTSSNTNCVLSDGAKGTMISLLVRVPY